MERKAFAGISIIGVCLFLISAASICVPAMGTPVLAADKIVLKAVTAWPKNTSMVEMGFNDWETRVNEKIKTQYPGQIELKWIGGSEAIAQMDQAAALKNGVVDVVMQAPSYCESIVPEAGAIKYSELTPWEDRATGAYVFWNKLFKAKMNCIYLGRHGRDIKFYYFLNKKVTKPDFTGLSLRTPPGVFSDLTKALGGSPIIMPTPDVYTALQRGVIDGYLTVTLAPVDLGWHEVTKYIIGPGFFTDPLIVLINLDTWNKLPNHLQTLLMDASKESELHAWDMTQVQKEQARQKYKKAGVQTIEFSGANARQYLDTVHRIAWGYAETKFPEVVPELKKLLSK